LRVINIRSSQSSMQDRKHFFQLICKNFVSLTHLDVTFTNQVSGGLIIVRLMSSNLDSLNRTVARSVWLEAPDGIEIANKLHSARQ